MRRSDLLALMMHRIMEAGVFSREEQFYAANMSPVKGTQTDFWIRETFTGDTVKRGTNRHTGRIFPTLIYTVAVPANTGTAILDMKENQIVDCFDLWDPGKCNFAGPGFAGEVKSIRIGTDFSNETWCFRPITLNLSIHIYDK